MMIIDDVLPEYQITAKYSTMINASPSVVYQKVWKAKILDINVFKLLMNIRELPPRLFGRREAFFPYENINVAKGMENSVFSTLGIKENEEAVFGLVGRFWDVINTDPKKVEGIDEFKYFDVPEYGKAVMNFYLEPMGNRTRLSTETRVYFKDKKYLKRFKIYWFFVRTFSGLTRKIFLREIKKEAEKSN